MPYKEENQMIYTNRRRLSVKDANSCVEVNALEKMRKDADGFIQRDQKILEKEKEWLSNQPPLNIGAGQDIASLALGEDGQLPFFLFLVDITGC